MRDRLGVSERRACKLLGQPRSTQRHRPKERDDERRLFKRIIELACLRVTGRTAGSGAGQVLAGLTSGTTCQSSVWVMTTGATEDVWLGLWVQSDAGAEYFECVLGKVGGSWTELSGSVTPKWSGPLHQALWVVGTDSTVDFSVDDASLVLVPATVGPLPGTWRREAQ